ncbi:hypothetical protein IW261DRAFT_1672227 [Armillaria novae-zelandiae]|uniref:Uncharacterized protein n=1 Tax=Armillaria novae-zelandiae TaxID=153914 RepID=A0AA39NS18_9AGAR|nr:hypothetical protein IW261DRAFT_1672227 [Armillaria novae-zelandiae]
MYDCWNAREWPAVNAHLTILHKDNPLYDSETTSPTLMNDSTDVRLARAPGGQEIAIGEGDTGRGWAKEVSWTAQLRGVPSLTGLQVSNEQCTMSPSSVAFSSRFKTGCRFWEEPRVQVIPISQANFFRNALQFSSESVQPGFRRRCTNSQGSLDSTPSADENTLKALAIEVGVSEATGACNTVVMLVGAKESGSVSQ